MELDLRSNGESLRRSLPNQGYSQYIRRLPTIPFAGLTSKSERVEEDPVCRGWGTVNACEATVRGGISASRGGGDEGPPQDVCFGGRVGNSALVVLQVADAAWRQASMDFASGARGDVRVLLGENDRPIAIWHDEFKALQANKNVRSIASINPSSGAQTRLWKI